MEPRQAEEGVYPWGRGQLQWLSTGYQSPKGERMGSIKAEVHRVWLCALKVAKVSEVPMALTYRGLVLNNHTF